MDPTNQMQYIVWAMGGLGETAFIHFSRSDRKFVTPMYIVILRKIVLLSNAMLCVHWGNFEGFPPPPLTIVILIMLLLCVSIFGFNS